MVIPVATPMTKVSENSLSQKRYPALSFSDCVLYQRRPASSMNTPDPKLMGTNKKW